MRVWICEKPSVADALSASLERKYNVKRGRKDGYFEVGAENVVTWCIGHLLSSYSPEEYDPKYKKWTLADLPIYPEDWKVKVTELDGVKKQAKIVQGLLKKASSIVHAGDTDREGQLIVDELLFYYKVYNKPTTRCLINDVNPKKIDEAVDESFKNDNKEYINSYYSGLGRQKADWLVGMNYSRTATLNAQDSGFDGVISIGRVQTPVLSLIVNRDLEIENFKPSNFFTISTIFEKDGKEFKGIWIPNGISLEQIEARDKINQKEEVEDEGGEDQVDTSLKIPDGFDEDLRLIDENLAKSIVDKINKAGSAKVISFKREQREEPRPTLFSMSKLQSAMSEFGFDAQKTLDITQKLYETHKILTYPRVDTVFIPTAHKAEVSDKLKLLLDNIPEFKGKKVDPNQKNSIFKDGKETEVHHAIIPALSEKLMLGQLNEDEYELYMMVARAYFANFMPPCLSDNVKVKIEVEGETFQITGKMIVQEGWREIYGNKYKSGDDELPLLEEGEELKIKLCEYKQSKTKAPSLFVTGKMPDYMGRVYLFVKDPEVRKKMKELSGIGTQATRAKILADLEKRKFITKVKKGKVEYYTSTEIGRNIVLSLPNQLTSFILTSQWETFLELIDKGQKTLEEFEKKLYASLEKTIELLKEADFSRMKGMTNMSGSGKKLSKTTNINSLTKLKEKCPKCGGVLVLRKVMKKDSKSYGKEFVGCNNFTTNKCDFSDWAVEKYTIEK